jgi:dynein heavy chain
MTALRLTNFLLLDMQAGRRNYVTPTSYLELITMFTTLLSAKRSEVLAAQHRYEIGLEKLEFTAGQVEAMRQELRALKPVLQKTVG